MSPADQSESITIARRGLVTGLLILCSAIVTLDITIATVALPHIQASLSAAPDTVSWVLTSYLIAAALATPVTGWLADLFGRRNLLLAAVGGFVVASGLCGAATSLEQLVLFRTLQGMLGAFVIPVSQSVLLDIYPKDQHTKAMSYFTLAQVGPIIGPLVGGLLTDALNWRWVFYINLPAGAVVVPGLFLFLPKFTNVPRRFDLFGYIFVAIAATCLQLVLDRGGQLDWFSSTEIIAEAILCVISLAIIVIHVSSGHNTLPDKRLLLNRTFICGLMFGSIHGALMTASSAFTPQILQYVYGYPVAAAGLAVVPRGFGAIFGAWLAARLAERHVDPRKTLGSAFLLSFVAFYWLAQFSPDAAMTPFLLNGFLQGITMGLAWPPMAALAFAAVDGPMRAEASGLFFFMRNVASAAFVAFPTYLLTRNAQINHAEMAERADSGIGHILHVVGRWADPTGAVSLRVLDAEINRQATMIAYLNDFMFLAWTSLAVIPLLFFMDWHATGSKTAEDDIPAVDMA